MSSRSQSVWGCAGMVRDMETKYYTQFKVDDPSLKKSNLFSGIVELHHAAGQSVSEAELQVLLAHNFDIDIEQVRLVSWSRLH